MKTLLALLLLVPSLSWGIHKDYDTNTTKIELNYLYGYILGTTLDKEKLTENGLKEFDLDERKDPENPYTSFSRRTDNDDNNSEYWQLKSNIVNKDFDTISVTVNKNSIISSIRLSKTIENEDLRNQLSGFLNLLDLKEIDGVSLTTCEDFKSTVIDAYRFKRGIDEKLSENYNYGFSTDNGTDRKIKSISSLSTIKDKKDNYLQVTCAYIPRTIDNERDLYTYFSMLLIDSNYFDFLHTKSLEKKDKEIEFKIINKNEFKTLLSVVINVNTDGL